MNISSFLSAAHIQKNVGGVPAFMKVEGTTLDEQGGALPSLTVHSLNSGNTDPKAVPTNIPTVATAKFSIRLVPGQEPQKVAALVRQHLEGIVWDSFQDTVKMELEFKKGSKPVRFDPQIAAAAWSRPAAFLPGGGSIPIVSHFEECLPDAGIVLWGGTNFDSRFHGPDEDLVLNDFRDSARGIAYLLGELSAISSAE